MSGQDRNFESFSVRFFYTDGTTRTIKMKADDKDLAMHNFSLQYDTTQVITSGTRTDLIDFTYIMSMRIDSFMDWDEVEEACNWNIQHAGITKERIEKFLGKKNSENELELLTLEDLLDVFNIDKDNVIPNQCLFKGEWNLYDDGYFSIQKEK